MFLKKVWTIFLCSNFGTRSEIGRTSFWIDHMTSQIYRVESWKPIMMQPILANITHKELRKCISTYMQKLTTILGIIWEITWQEVKTQLIHLFESNQGGWSYNYSIGQIHCLPMNYSFEPVWATASAEGVATGVEECQNCCPTFKLQLHFVPTAKCDCLRQTLFSEGSPWRHTSKGVTDPTRIKNVLFGFWDINQSFFVPWNL